MLQTSTWSLKLMLMQVVELVRRSRSSQFSSVQDGIYALGKAHTRSTPSLRCLIIIIIRIIKICKVPILGLKTFSPNVACETVQMLV